MLQCNLVTNPQTQLGYKISQAQLSTKRKDLRQMQVLKPYLKQLQQNSAKLVKDYHEYLSNKDRKVPGLPYHMIKKFELLQTTLNDTRKILITHCREFELEVSGRDFDKDNQQHFFKKTMKSYDQRRLWLKNYILKNEARMQVVQEEVKKNVDYETHKFTQYIHEVDLQRLQHNYEPKIEAQQQLLQKVQANARLRDKIKAHLQRHRGKSNKVLITVKEQSEINVVKQYQEAPQKAIQSQFRLKSLLSFLNFYLMKKSIYKMFLTSELKRVRQQKALLSQKNQQLKIAIDLQFQNMEDSKLQWMITEGSYQNQSSLLSKNQPSLLSRKQINPATITKTDYFIYLREIHRQVQHKIKLYGLEFRYMLFLPESSFYSRTKSVTKRYMRSKPSQNILKIQSNTLKTYLLNYARKQRATILSQRKVRQKQREQRLSKQQEMQKMKEQLQKQLENNKLQPQSNQAVQLFAKEQILHQLLQKGQEQDYNTQRTQP